MSGFPLPRPHRRRPGPWRAGLWAGFLLALAACGEKLPVLKPGDPAPPFALESLDGGVVSLHDLRGRYVLVRFWADWCKSCRTEMPLIDEEFRAHRGTGLAVLALNVRQDRKTAERFTRDVGIGYPVLLDADGAAAASYGVLGLPTTFLVDRQGNILEEIIGEMNRRSLSALLDPLFPAGAGGGTT